ncbi:MAG: endonuclease/exonuclease/phosphatase family protein [Nitrospirota bacterium]|jgi:endonuclease/exonuclease/phosphatase family metal-dependent hydrolase
MLRLATLNLAFVDHNVGPAANPARPRFPSWEERRVQIGRVLSELLPDVLCLQEAISWQASVMAPHWVTWLEERSGQSPLPERFDQVADLSRLLPGGYQVVGPPLPVSVFRDEEMAGLGWGTVIFSRLPVRDHYRVVLPHDRGDMTRRVPLFAQIEADDGPLWVASVHCDPLTRHVDALCDAVTKLPETTPVALLGDFNLDDRSPLYPRLIATGLSDCRAATTPEVRWRADAPAAVETTIDHCLVRHPTRTPVVFHHINDYPYSDIHWLQAVDLE